MEYISHVKLGDETVDASIEAADRDSPVEVWIKVCKLDKQGEPIVEDGKARHEAVEIRGALSTKVLQRIYREIAGMEKDNADALYEERRIDRSLGK